MNNLFLENKVQNVDHLRDNNIVLPEESCNWYAVYTKSNFETRAYEGLFRKGMKVFLPKRKVLSQRKDRKKINLVPLLRGYLFVNAQLTTELRWEILKSIGVVRLVGMNNQPVPIGREEISNLMILNGTDLPIEQEYSFAPGDKVKIIKGPLEGLVGTYIYSRMSSGKIQIRVDALNLFLTVGLRECILKKT